MIDQESQESVDHSPVVSRSQSDSVSVSVSESLCNFLNSNEQFNINMHTVVWYSISYRMMLFPSLLLVSSLFYYLLIIFFSTVPGTVSYDTVKLHGQHVHFIFIASVLLLPSATLAHMLPFLGTTVIRRRGHLHHSSCIFLAPIHCLWIYNAAVTAAHKKTKDDRSKNHRKNGARHVNQHHASRHQRLIQHVRFVDVE